jgi:hypothetical protein
MCVFVGDYGMTPWYDCVCARRANADDWNQLIHEARLSEQTLRVLWGDRSEAEVQYT